MSAFYLEGAALSAPFPAGEEKRCDIELSAACGAQSSHVPLWLWQRCRLDDETPQSGVKRMLGIGAVKAVVSIGATRHNSGGVEESEFSLDVVQCEKT